jgi:hypothetical protein
MGRDGECRGAASGDVRGQGCAVGEQSHDPVRGIAGSLAKKRTDGGVSDCRVASTR